MLKSTIRLRFFWFHDCSQTDAIPQRSRSSHPSTSWKFDKGVCYSAGCHDNRMCPVYGPSQVICLGCNGNTYCVPWHSAPWALSSPRGAAAPFKHKVRDRVRQLHYLYYQSRSEIKKSLPKRMQLLIRWPLLCSGLEENVDTSVWDHLPMLSELLGLKFGKTKTVGNMKM